MNFKKILFSALLAVGCLSATAQQTEEVFNHHWYIQAQGGAQYNLGEVAFNKLLTPNVQVSAGYRFTPVWGLRLGVNGWQAKAGSKLTSGNYYWKYNYVAPQLDVTFDLTNAIGGYKKRLCSVGLLAGLGANIGWNNGEAADVNTQMALDHGFPAGSDVAYLRYLWDGTKARINGRVGAYLDFHVCSRVDLGIEVTGTTLSDHYNSKKAGNTDWYFTALAGVKVNLGKTHKTKQVVDPCAGNIQYIEKVVEKPVEKIVEKVVYKDAEKREPLRRDIFFVIRGSEVSSAEMPKVEDVVAYLNKYADAKVSITGYADKGTGNAKLNIGYAQKRAQMVADLLVNKFGISRDRITVDSKGDTEQPYEKNELNRVSICIAE